MAISDEIMLRVENVSKVYKLGEIGGTTLRDALQRRFAKIRHKEDPTKKIGAKNYNKGEKFKALDNVSFEIKKGERIGIIGHNGAGKSTLLKLISRVTGPTEGTISMNGRVASMLEVGTGFHPELTGRENIYMNGAILGMTKKEIDEKIEDIIDFSEVRQFIDTPVKRYSSGMYVKLAFSVAAHLDSEIVIMDEVLAVGDAQFQNKCIEKMKSISENDDRTILYVSHNMNTIKLLCNKVMVLEHGKLIYAGDVEQGISLYYGLLEPQTEYDYSSKINDGWKDSNFTLKNLILEKNSRELFYERGESIRGKLFFDCKKVFNDLYLRFEILNTNNSPVGTSLSSKITFDQQNDGFINFSLNSTPFSPGRYFVCVMFFTIDNYGNQVQIDSVFPGLIFDILDSNCIIKWDSTYWGNVILPDIETW